MIVIYEDKDFRDSIPTNLVQLFKHILNCIYQPELYHGGWKKTILTQHSFIMDAVRKLGTKRVTKIINDSINASYDKGYKEFFNELADNYDEREIRKVIPKKVTDIGKGTVYEKYRWNAETFLNPTIINQFLKEVKDNSTSIYDLYK